jgi:hypothetical protein
MIFYCLEKLFHFFIGFSLSLLLFHFFIGLSLSLLLNDFFERRYPEEYSIFIEKIGNLLVGASYNCIYYYSKIQIFFYTCKDNLNTFIDNNPTLSNLRDDINKILTKKTHGPNYTFYSVKDSDIYNVETSCKYFVICHDTNERPISKKLFYDKIYIHQNNITLNKSTSKFLLIEFTIGEKDAYKINLATSVFDYYFVDNKFTKEFFIYYVKTYLNPELTATPDTICSIKLIDNDVNTRAFDFTNNESITLTSDGYKINSSKD